ncbi:MAG: hypothetical protein DHS20C19_12150 [Acidimicrobiales bacterium]|nr:MAG: hypothetical protein DHS20C19_12150 [Acidimicrobiales bacterium]
MSGIGVTVVFATVTTEPTLADDEMRLAEIAADLLARVRAAAPVWLRQRSAALCAAAGVAGDGVDAAVDDTLALLDPELERILLADPDAGAGSPLAAIRASTRPLTEQLRSIGVPPVIRDAFSQENFRDDLFDFGPAAFADIHESLHEPGLMWGAARAHVHLRRRREADT